jgi:hypothetical protein
MTGDQVLASSRFAQSWLDALVCASQSIPSQRISESEGSTVTSSSVDRPINYLGYLVAITSDTRNTRKKLNAQRHERKLTQRGPCWNCYWNVWNTMNSVMFLKKKIEILTCYNDGNNTSVCDNVNDWRESRNWFLPIPFPFITYHPLKNCGTRPPRGAVSPLRGSCLYEGHI